MKNCITNKVSYAHKKAAKASKVPKSNIDFDVVQREMKEECARKNPSESLLKSALNDVRKRRLQDAKCDSVSSHLKYYPALRDPSLVSNSTIPGLGVCKQENVGKFSLNGELWSYPPLKERFCCQIIM